MQRTDLSERTLMLGKIESKRRSGWQKKSWLDSITDSMDMNLSKLWETVREFILGSSKITANGDCSHEIKKMLVLWKKSYDQPRQHIKKQRHYLANKGPPSQSYGFSSGHVWM